MLKSLVLFFVFEQQPYTTMVLAETKTLPMASQLKTRGSLMVSTWLSILLVLVVITLHWCDPQPYSQVKPLSRSLTPLRPLLLYSNFLPALPARPWVIVPLGGWERVVGIMWRWRGGHKIISFSNPKFNWKCKWIKHLLSWCVYKCVLLNELF